MISDRQQKNTIYNKWLKKNIEYSSNTVEDGNYRNVNDIFGKWRSVLFIW